MSAAAPVCRPARRSRCRIRQNLFAKGRFILPFFFALPAAAQQGGEASPGKVAAVFPAPAEVAAAAKLNEAGARRARAMARYVAAEQMLREKGAAAALPLFKEVMALDPPDGALATRVASLAAAAGQPEEAFRLLEEAVKKNPAAPGPAVALTRFLLDRSGEGPEAASLAARQLQRAQAAFPGNPELCALVVRTSVMDQRRADAQAAVRQTLARGSSDPGFYLLMAPAAREAFPLDDPDTRSAHLAIVAGCLEKALALAPADPAVLAEAADQYSRMNLPAKAAESFRRVIAADPADLTARRRLGQMLRQSGDTAGAITALTELLQIDPGDAAAHRTLASMYEAAARPREALHHQVEILRISGGAVEEYLKLSRRLEEAGMAADARLTLERGCFAWPRSARLAIAHATALHAAGRITEAEAEFERALSEAGKHEPAALDAPYYLARARCARDAGRRDMAAVHFRKAIDLAPAGKNNPVAAPAYAGLALLWLEDDARRAEAAELLRVAASFTKDDPAVIEARGLLAARNGDWPAALAEYRRIEARLTAPASRLRLAEALLQTGDKTGAAAVLEKAAASEHPAAQDQEKLKTLRAALAAP